MWWSIPCTILKHWILKSWNLKGRKAILLMKKGSILFSKLTLLIFNENKKLIPTQLSAQNYTKETNLSWNISKSISLDLIPYNPVFCIKIFMILPSALQILAKCLLWSPQPTISWKAWLKLLMLQTVFVEYFQVKKGEIDTLKVLTILFC